MPSSAIVAKIWWQPWTGSADKTIRAGQGSEFISRDMDLSVYQGCIVLDFSRPCKRTESALIEAFNGRFRAKCLNQHWLFTVADAVERMEAWRRYYNEELPQGAISNKVPAVLTKSGGIDSPSPWAKPENPAFSQYRVGDRIKTSQALTVNEGRPEGRSAFRSRQVTFAFRNKLTLRHPESILLDTFKFGDTQHAYPKFYRNLGNDRGVGE